jgi:predicted RNA-binding protein with PUA-like domain
LLFLFKEEPDHYSYDQLAEDGKTVWDGVSNNLALIHLRKVKPRDRIFYYHTGNERAVVGIMEATSAAYPDPREKDEKLVVVDVRPLKKLGKPVTLEEVKARKKEFEGFELLRIPRLSVMPVPQKLWNEIMNMAGEAH